MTARSTEIKYSLCHGSTLNRKSNAASAMAARLTENQIQPLLRQHALCKQKTEHWDGYCAFVTVRHMFMASNQLRLGEGRRKTLVGILQRGLQ